MMRMARHELMAQAAAAGFDLWRERFLARRTLIQKSRCVVIKWRLRSVARCMGTWSEGVVHRRVWERQRLKLLARASGMPK